MLSCETKDDLIDMETLEQVAPILRNAAHPLRLRMLDFLRIAGTPQTVTQIIEASGASQANVSQQLRILKDSGIVASRRQGNNVLYSVAYPNVLLLLDCIRRHKDEHN